MVYLMAGGDPQDLAGCVAAIMSGDPGSMTTGGTAFNTAGQQVNTTLGTVTTKSKAIQQSWRTPAAGQFETAVQRLVAEGRTMAQLAIASQQPLTTAATALTDAQTQIQALAQAAAAAQAAAPADTPLDMTAYDQQAMAIFATLKTAYQDAIKALAAAPGQPGAGAPGAGAPGAGTPGGGANPAAGGPGAAPAGGNAPTPGGGGAPPGGATPGGATPGGATPGGTPGGQPQHVYVNAPTPGGATPPTPLSTPTDPNVPAYALSIGGPDPGAGLPSGPTHLVGTDPTGLLTLGRTTGTADPSTVLTGYTGSMTPASPMAGPPVAAPVAPTAPGGPTMSPLTGMGYGGGPSSLTSAGPQRGSRSDGRNQTIAEEATTRQPISLGAPGSMSPYVGGRPGEEEKEEERKTRLRGQDKWTDEQIPENILGRPGSL